MASRSKTKRSGRSRKTKPPQPPPPQQAQSAAGLITVDKKLNVLAADRFFLDAVGSSTGEPEGKPLAEVLGRSPAEQDPLAAMENGENRAGSIETERATPGGMRKLKVDFARTKLENDESAIFMTVEAVPVVKPGEPAPPEDEAPSASKKRKKKR